MRRRHDAGPFVPSSAYRELRGYSIPAEQLTGRVATVLAGSRNALPHRRESRPLGVGKAFQCSRFNHAAAYGSGPQGSKGDRRLAIISRTARFEAPLPHLGRRSAGDTPPDSCQAPPNPSVRPVTDKRPCLLPLHSSYGLEDANRRERRLAFAGSSRGRRTLKNAI